MGEPVLRTQNILIVKVVDLQLRRGRFLDGQRQQLVGGVNILDKSDALVIATKKRDVKKNHHGDSGANAKQQARRVLIEKKRQQQSKADEPDPGRCPGKREGIKCEDAAQAAEQIPAVGCQFGLPRHQARCQVPQWDETDGVSREDHRQKSVHGEQMTGMVGVFHTECELFGNWILQKRVDHRKELPQCMHESDLNGQQGHDQRHCQALWQIPTGITDPKTEKAR